MRDVQGDGRYSVRLEWCGHPSRRWVARFCGEWIGCAESRADAVKMSQAFR